MFPIQLRTTQNSARLPYYADKRTDLSTQMAIAMKTGNDIEIRKIKEKMTLLHKEWGFEVTTPMTAAMMSIVTYMSCFFCFRKCASVPYPGWETGGTLWFPDLTVADPYFILPVLSGAMICTNQLVPSFTDLADFSCCKG